MRSLGVGLIGAGNRGRYVFGRWALRHPDRMRVVALAEPRDDRRAAVAAEHGLSRERVFDSWQALFAAGLPLDAVIIATGDTEHVEPALEAFARGHHVLLE
jgi:predicted dehydrogenase